MPRPWTTLPVIGARPQVRPELLAVAGAGLAIGSVFLFFFDSGWAHAVGVVALFVFVAAGFIALATLVAEAAD